MYCHIYKLNDTIQTTHWQQLQSTNAHTKCRYSVSAQRFQKLRALIRHSSNSFSHVATAKFVRNVQRTFTLSRLILFLSVVNALPTLLTNRTYVLYICIYTYIILRVCYFTNVMCYIYLYIHCSDMRLGLLWLCVLCCFFGWQFRIFTLFIRWLWCFFCPSVFFAFILFGC